MRRTRVSSGAQVNEGDVLVELNNEAEEADLEGAELEYERKLASFLFDPANDGARESLASIAARRQRAKRAVESRQILAPRSGVVSDVRVTEGNLLQPGDHILTLVAEDALPTVVALLPGADRPRLRVGQTLQLQLPGYEKSRERLVIREVGQEVIGPEEARRYLGDKIAGSITTKSSVVIVRARIESRTFMARDKQFRFHDGMAATAEVSVRTRRVIVALVPGLERLL